MAPTYTEVQLDALREVANIASSTAATALSSLTGIPVDVSTPAAYAIPLAEAIAQAGPGEMVVTTVVVPVTGDLEALVLMVMPPATEAAACRLVGVESGSEVGDSAITEIGNILSASYLGALASLTGLALEPSPPERVRDMLRAVLTSAVLAAVQDGHVLVLESTLSVAGQECSPTFLLVPTLGSVDDILERLSVPA
jgi:chemotaxis protein CheC